MIYKHTRSAEIAPLAAREDLFSSFSDEDVKAGSAVNRYISESSTPTENDKKMAPVHENSYFSTRRAKESHRCIIMGFKEMFYEM